MPGLLLAIPQHPQVADVEEERGPKTDQRAHEASRVSDRSARPKVRHPDSQRPLAERLAGGAAFEESEVGSVKGQPDPSPKTPERKGEDNLWDKYDESVEKLCAKALLEVGSRSRRPGRRYWGTVVLRRIAIRPVRSGRWCCRLAGDLGRRYVHGPSRCSP
jgi:hypothetical protein